MQYDHYFTAHLVDWIEAGSRKAQREEIILGALREYRIYAIVNQYVLSDEDMKVLEAMIEEYAALGK